MGPFWEILEKMIVKTRFGWDPFCSWWIAEGSINGTYGVPLTPAPEKGWVWVGTFTRDSIPLALPVIHPAKKEKALHRRKVPADHPAQPKIK